MNTLQATTLCEAFQITAAQRPGDVALRTVGGTVEITWADYAARVKAIAGGFASLGLQRGDTVAIMLTNRPEFFLVDAAAMHLGAAPFSIYNTSSPEQIEYLFSNAENRIVVCERQFLDTLQSANAPSVEHIVVIDDATSDTILLADLEQRAPDGFDFEATWRAVTPDDILTLIYTSGTTGPPKGVQLTHGNMLAQNRALASEVPMAFGGRVLSYLPSAHIADRLTSQYYPAIMFGATVTAVADAKQIVAALADARPTAWIAVPRVWEKMKAALETQGVVDPSSMPDDAKAAILKKIGLDSVEWSMCGAAPIPNEVLEYFGALGLPICEVWGMSEVLVGTCNPRNDIRIGTVGKALPGYELKLLEDGELLTRGPTVMKGYRNDPERTAEAIDSDGWMHTGDIATIDADGYVTIVDRKKELIISSGGKNMSPANIENHLKAGSPMIGQVVCIGDRRPYNVALIVLDPDASAKWASERGLSDASPKALCDDDEVQAEIARGVEEANSHLSRVEQIKRFRVLPVDWEPSGDELTPTSKLRRKPIAEKYKVEIEELYSA